MDRRGIIGVVIGVMMAVGVVLWMGRAADRHDEPSDPSAAAVTADPEPLSTASEGEDVSAETPEDPGYVTRLPNYAAASSASEPHWTEMGLPIQFTAGNLVSLARQLFDAALDGSIVAALELGSARQVCNSVARTPELFDARLKQQLDRAARYRERGATFPESDAWKNRPGSAQGSDEEIRAREMAWFDSCQSLHQFISDDLREEVDRLARQGDPAARLVYALLRPDIRGNPNWLNDIENWERTARAYTEANLAEKRPEGLIGAGIGHSMDGWQYGIRNFEYPMAYWLAAALCGVEHPVLQDLVTHIAQGNSVLGKADSDHVVRMAADLHQRYCFNAP